MVQFIRHSSTEQVLTVNILDEFYDADHGEKKQRDERVSANSVSTLQTALSLSDEALHMNIGLDIPVDMWLRHVSSLFWFADDGEAAPGEQRCQACVYKLHRNVNDDPQNVFEFLDGLMCCLLLIAVYSAAMLRDFEMCSAVHLAPMQPVVYAGLNNYALPALYAETLFDVTQTPLDVTSDKAAGHQTSYVTIFADLVVSVTHGVRYLYPGVNTSIETDVSQDVTHLDTVSVPNTCDVARAQQIMTLIQPNPEMQLRIRTELNEDVNTRNQDLEHIKEWFQDLKDNRPNGVAVSPFGYEFKVPGLTATSQAGEAQFSSKIAPVNEATWLGRPTRTHITPEPDDEGMREASFQKIPTVIG
uniref:Uncharacterized protein n=1 Tax=Timema bartmani TaxID=61472 RepID=A0A7R9ENG9_9NEOP|nr:unnamed protein product [Timema bartmani]